jgi:alkylation response protein AidB-like acyl-CoA dehydrogenase
MDFEVAPLTPAGHRFVALAEDHARDFATRAERHDREGSFPVENIEALRRSGASGATVPAELGGLGVDSIHDYAVGVNRLGRGDGSTALAANMHIFRTWFIAMAWREARATGAHEEAARWESLLRRIASGEVVRSRWGSSPSSRAGQPAAVRGPVPTREAITRPMQQAR